MNLNETVDAKAAGETLGISPLTVHWLRRQGRLGGIKVGGRIWLFGRDEVARLAAEREGRRLTKAS